jgi:hypothetical protein
MPVEENEVAVVIKQKRGRKPKQVIIPEPDTPSDTITPSVDNTVVITEDKILKKRGRKPKGGKIVQQKIINQQDKPNKPNIMLHLKCSINDLTGNNVENCIDSFTFANNKTELAYEIVNDEKNIIIDHLKNQPVKTLHTTYSCEIEHESFEDDCNKTKSNDSRSLWNKLKELQHNLHNNNVNDRKSACFWCTCDFDNPSIYIPKHYVEESYHVYGCFCSPECATAYLMEENIDDSSKFERYFLLNNIYSKIYNYSKNIKPAPNPRFLLDKYYGNLSIQEYRGLLQSDRLFLIVDKPLTRILPELHEDNDAFIINNKIIPSNTYQLKKQHNKQNKNSIVNEKFGLSA